MRPIFYPSSAPVVSAHFVAIGAPLDSFGVSSWSDGEPAAPSVEASTARTVSESVLAWRARYYAFRAAVNRVQRGNVAALREILAGPHGDYVRERFAELAAADARFNVPALDAAPPAGVIAPEQATPAVPAAIAPQVDAPERSTVAHNVAPDFVTLAATALPASVTLSRNLERDGLELRFTAKPAGDVREALKVVGWRWSHTAACWYVRADVPALARSRPLCQSIAALMMRSPARVDPPEQATPATDGERAKAAALADYFDDAAARLAKAAAPLEIRSTQNYTPKRGRQWAEKSHNASNVRRAEAAAKVLADAWREVANGGDVSAITPELRGKICKSDLCRRTATRGKSEGYYHYCDAFTPADDSPAAVLLREFVAGRSDGAANAERKREAELAAAIFKLCGYDIPGFFPTPAPLAALAVHTLNILPGASVLEPSAGIGDLAEAARKAGGVVTACEVLEAAAAVLRLKGYDETGGSLHVGDFLAMTPGDVGTFDRVAMNPPFENDAAARHVLHAFAFLKPGGRLVAIVPANYREKLTEPTRGAAATLAEMLASDAVDSWRCSEPIADAFAGADAFRTTGIAVCILDVIKSYTGPRTGDDAPEQATSPTLPPAAPVAPVPAPTTPASAVDDAPTQQPAQGGVIVQSKAFRKALQSLIAAIPTPKPKTDADPKTKQVRLWTVGNVLRVGALDHPNVPTVDLAGVQVDRPLDVGVVGGKVLLDIFTLTNDDTMSIAVEGSSVLIRGADSRYELYSAPVPASLPGHVAPVDDASHWMTTTAAELAEVIRLVEFATAKEQGRYAFNSLAFEFCRDRCDVVATDGRRLIVQQLAGNVKPTAAGIVLIDRSDAKALRRALANLPKSAPVHVCVGEPARGEHVRPVSVIGAALEWRGLEVDANFPGWREILPQVDSQSPRYKFDVVDLAAALKRASTMTAEDSKGLRFDFDTGGRGRVQLTSRNPESGETVAFCQAIDASGETFGSPIGFNPEIIGEALRAAKRGTVTLALTAPNRPGVFTFDSGARYVLMPVNLQ